MEAAVKGKKPAYQEDPFPALEWEIAGIQPEEAAEWVVGCTIWLREDALATMNDKFNNWMVEHITKYNG